MALKRYLCDPYKSIPTHLGEQANKKNKRRKNIQTTNKDSENSQLKIRLRVNNKR